MLAAGSGSRVLTVPGFVYGNHWFLTPPHKFDLPCPITKKLLQVVTSKTATPKPNVGANPPIGGFWANAWNIINFLFIYTLFGNSPTGQTGWQICTLDGSNDADLRKDVPFWVSFILCHCHSLSLASVKSRLALRLWYLLSRVVWDRIHRAVKRLCVCVCEGCSVQESPSVCPTYDTDSPFINEW